MRPFSTVATALCLALILASLSLPSARAQVRDASIPELIKQLDDQGEKSVDRRRDAAYEFVRRGERTEEVIAALGKATSDDDSQVRIQSLTALARAGKAALPVLPTLIDSLSNRDAQVRYRAAAAVGSVGTAALEPLAKRWENASNETRVAMAQALAIIGPEASSTIPLLNEGLNGQDPLPRYSAEALLAISPGDEASMLRIADHEDSVARKVGILGLAALTSPSKEAVTKIQKAVNDTDEKIREAAIVAVAKSSLALSEKQNLIEGALLDQVPSVRAAAIIAMRKAALPPAEFAQRLVSRLPSSDEQSANTIIKAIAILGSGARATLPSIVAVAGKENIDQQLVARTLASFGADAVPELLAAIEQHPVNEPIFSQALGLIGQPAVESLVKGLASDVELVRMAATRALGSVRPVSRALLLKLVGALKDPSASVRAVAVESLVNAAKEADFTKDDVLVATEDTDPAVRGSAIQALRHFKYTDEQSRTAIQRGLKDESPLVRTATLGVLIDLPKLLRARDTELTQLVEDVDPRVRATAAAALGKLDSKQVNEAIIAALVKALGDNEPSVRIAATESVRSLAISDPKVLDAISANLVENLELLRASLEALTVFGEKAAPVIPAVAHLSTHEKADVRVAALNALSAIEKDSQQLTNRLTVALEDKEWEVRRIAGVALGKLGPAAIQSVPKLFQMLTSDEDRDFASAALKEINTAPVEAIPLLMSKLDSDERRTAFYAVLLLGKIGPPAAEALPKLESMLGRQSNGPGRSDFRRRFLVDAIAAIKGESKDDQAKQDK